MLNAALTISFPSRARDVMLSRDPERRKEGWKERKKRSQVYLYVTFQQQFRSKNFT